MLTYQETQNLDDESVIYLSPSKLRFKILHLAKNAQFCQQRVVVYTNLDKTKDAPIGTIWTIEERLFCQMMAVSEEKVEAIKPQVEEYITLRSTPDSFHGVFWNDPIPKYIKDGGLMCSDPNTRILIKELDRRLAQLWDKVAFERNK